MEPTEIKKQTKPYVNGYGNWTIIMLTLCVTVLITDNFERHGLIKNPLEIIQSVIHAIIDHWWLYIIIILCIIQQTLHLYLIEKLLSLQMLSEKLGLILHAANAFFSAVIFVVIARIYTLNPGITRGVMQFVFYKIPKMWSYAYVNYVLRTQNIENKKNDTKSSIYPSNVTLRNAFTYVVFTPDIQYTPGNFRRTHPNWKGYIKKMSYIFLLYCLLTFIIVQFLKPNVLALKSQKMSFTSTSTLLLKIAIFLHAVWLTSYLISYKLFHPAYADLMGMQHLVFDSDWWNSTDLMDFWRRWNFVVHVGMKNTVVKPLLAKGWSKQTVELIAFGVAGVLHEILYTLPLGSWPGEAVFATLLEIPFGKVSMYLAKKYGTKYGNMSMWMYLFIIHTCAVVYMCCNYNFHGSS